MRGGSGPRSSQGGSAALSVNNSTFSGNSATEDAGGIYNDGVFRGSATLSINNSTFSGNSATYRGAIVNQGFLGSATVTIGNTILNAGSGQNIYNNSGTVTSLGYNLSSDDASAFLNQTGDQNSTDPMLGLLQNNGGPTFTHELLTGSPAIDAGDPNFDPNNFDPPMIYDQRGAGFDRVVNGRIDIGAFEVLTPTQRIQALEDTINALVDQGRLDRGNGRSLNAKLAAAINSLSQGNITDACDELAAFIKQTRALIRARRISEADGQALIDSVTAIQSQIGC